MGRSQLILWAPMMLLWILLTWAFFDRLWDTHSRRLAEDVVGDIALADQLLTDFPHQRAFLFPLMAEKTEIEFTFTERPRDSSVASVQEKDFYIDYRRFLQESLSRRFPQRHVTFRTDRGLRKTLIWIERDEEPQGVLHAVVPRHRLFNSTTSVFVVFMTFGALFFVSIAALFMRNQIRPMNDLAHAMETFGQGHDSDMEDGRAEQDKPLTLRGAREVRRAIAVFQGMKERIKRHWQQQYMVLTSISHDINTVIARMKLQLAIADGKDMKSTCDSGDTDNKALMAGLEQDVTLLQNIVKEYIDFLRVGGRKPQDDIEDVDVEEMLETLLEDVPRPLRKSIRLVGREQGAKKETKRLMVKAHRGDLKRCLMNILHNAERFAETIELSVHAGRDGLSVIVDDDGVGIAPSMREEALRPFSRLDTSRNLNHEGVGLGLAIADTVMRQHQGRIMLEESPLGGLRVRLFFPKERT